MAGQESNGDEDENAHRRSKRSGSMNGRDRSKIHDRSATNAKDSDLERALAESELSAARENEKREMETAMQLSKEEEEKRIKALEEANQRSLFDDQAQSPA